MKKVLLFLILVVAFCSSCATTQSVVIERSKTIHRTVHVEYLKYVDADASLLPAQKEIRKNRIKAYGVLLNETK